jgi:hypothetical protein
MKKLNPNQFIEKNGVNAIATLVNRMGCTWRPTPNDDYGIDGEIELNKEGAPTGKIIKVQSKSGSSYIKGLTQSKFDFYADKGDLDYWNNSNLPVILIVIDFSQNVFHWVNIKEYLIKKPEVLQGPHKITFNLKFNRFNIKSFFNLCKMVLNEKEFVEVTKNIISEEIFSNLLPIIELPNKIYGFTSDYNQKQIFDLLKGSFIPSFYVAENKVWTFSDILDETNPLIKVCNNKDSICVIQAQNWLLDENKKKWYVSLIKKAIKNHCRHLGLILDKKDKYYFPPKEDLNTNLCDRIIKYNAFKRKGTRKVAYQYIDNKGIKRFWVHHAVTLDIRSFGGRWYLKIEPGYIFTHDGINFIASDKIGRLNTKRKAREWNNAVLNHLIFWRETLSNNKQNIIIPLGKQKLVINKNYESGLANFGIMKDKTRMDSLVNFDEDFELNEEMLNEDE